MGDGQERSGAYRRREAQRAGGGGGYEHHVYRPLRTAIEHAGAGSGSAPLIALCDAAALLWRHDIYGLERPPGSRQAVAAFASQAFPRAGISFADVHCALAYAAAGDAEALSRLLGQLRQRLAQDKMPAGEVVPAIVEALAAFARSDYEGAVQHLEPVAHQVVRVGGSNAQREVIEDTLLQAYLRAGRYAQAEALLRRRLTRRPSARDTTWLQQAQSAQRAVGSS